MSGNLITKTERKENGGGTSRSPLTARKIHKWGGLIAAGWLAVLGFTGFLLDHRDWRWMWQETVPEFLVPNQTAEKSNDRDFLLYRVDASDPYSRITAGKRGMWTSADGGAHWRKTGFIGLGSSPQIFSVIDDSAGWKKIWLATDDGIWISTDGGMHAKRFALDGKSVTAMELGSDNTELLAVVDRSEVFIVNTESGNAPERLDLQGVKSSELPSEFGLSRFVRDLHYGRGIVTGITSLIINDIAGIALLLLPITGILFWLLPDWWKQRRLGGEHIPPAKKRRTMKILLHSHGTVAGLLAAIPIIYLSVTGIIIDHSEALMGWMKTVKIERKWLPPVYEMGSWDDEIYSIAGYPGVDKKLSLGTRGGLYTSNNGGGEWSRERLPGPPSSFIWTLRRLGDNLFIGGMGSPNLLKDGNGPWEKVRGIGHMPSDASLLHDGKYLFTGHAGLKVGNLKEAFTSFKSGLPTLEGVPWFYVIDGLHSGLIIHSQWIWVNDAVSLLAILLTVTGLLRWWRTERGGILGHLTPKKLTVRRLGIILDSLPVLKGVRR